MDRQNKRNISGRGMTSDPKQAFRMALKKSPCIRAVIVPNIQEDWRTFQIIQKCHQNLSDESECTTSESKRASVKLKTPPRTIEMDMPSFKIVFPSSFADDDEKIPNGHCKISLSDLTSNKSSENLKMNCNDDKISVIINSQSELHNFIIQRASQNKNKKEYKLLSDSQLAEPISLGNNHQNPIREEESNETVICCRNPCCRYAMNAKANNFNSRFQVRNELAPSYIPQRNSFNIPPQLINDSYSPSPSYESLSFDAGSYISNMNQPNIDAFHSNSHVNSWSSNNKFNCNSQNSEIKENSSPFFDLISFQQSYDMQSNNQPSNDVRGFQNYDTSNTSLIFRPGEELMQKNQCPTGVDFDFENTDQSFNVFYPKDDAYDKGCSAYSQWNSYETQQMVPCNWA
ncbi:UNVERIFIED_CONTAM: hypothetical protein RMT77_008334 [Armadillidium vulgare]